MATRPRLAKKDRQCARVYSWGWSFADWNIKTLTKRQCRKWVKWCLKQFHLKKGSSPAVVFPPRAKYSSFEPEYHELQLIKKHRNIPMVLHETAHYVQSILYGKTTEDHGPEFMGIWLYLLEAAQLCPKGTLTASAKSKGIKIDMGMGPELVKKLK
jgi:hypothetical protein